VLDGGIYIRIPAGNVDGNRAVITGGISPNAVTGSAVQTITSGSFAVDAWTHALTVTLVLEASSDLRLVSVLGVLAGCPTDAYYPVKLTDSAGNTIIMSSVVPDPSNETVTWTAILDPSYEIPADGAYWVWFWNGFSTAPGITRLSVSMVDVKR